MCCTRLLPSKTITHASIYTINAIRYGPMYCYWQVVHLRIGRSWFEFSNYCYRISTWRGLYVHRVFRCLVFLIDFEKKTHKPQQYLHWKSIHGDSFSILCFPSQYGRKVFINIKVFRMSTRDSYATENRLTHNRIQCIEPETASMPKMPKQCDRMKWTAISNDVDQGLGIQ